MARYLYTECKASLQSRNKDGLTPLMCAVQQVSHAHGPLMCSLSWWITTLSSKVNLDFRAGSNN